jgi:hypothetical protein
MDKLVGLLEFLKVHGQDEVAVLLGAPVTSLVLLIIALGGAWALYLLFAKSKVDTLNERLNTLEERRKGWEEHNTFLKERLVYAEGAKQRLLNYCALKVPEFPNDLLDLVGNDQETQEILGQLVQGGRLKLKINPNTATPDDFANAHLTADELRLSANVSSMATSDLASIHTDPSSGQVTVTGTAASTDTGDYIREVAERMRERGTVPERPVYYVRPLSPDDNDWN